ncbi:CatB-related O-acetyltransferase [Paenibacillus sp. P26]|nr:CatB-related O-acetyltransferase [Paenibacillus sp. P26]UUZ93054.1 CatB-related O-acetyltransferase [Paenibacillus sp. P25]
MNSQELKGTLVRKISGFFDYWLAHDMRRRYGIDSSVIVSPGAHIEKEVQIGRRSFIGRRTMVVSGQIGAFTSIADHVVIGSGEHQLDAVTTHMEWHVKTYGRNWENIKPPPVIGNDVWIGTGVTVLRGAVIEDGAVIGAGAVVRGHVPAYGIAVGIPERVVRYRFDEELREALRSTQWWEWDDRSIEEAYPLFGDVKQFLDYAARRNQKEHASNRLVKERITTISG